MPNPTVNPATEPGFQLTRLHRALRSVERPFQFILMIAIIRKDGTPRITNEPGDPLHHHDTLKFETTMERQATAYVIPFIENRGARIDPAWDAEGFRYDNEIQRWVASE